MKSNKKQSNYKLKTLQELLDLAAKYAQMIMKEGLSSGEMMYLGFLLRESLTFFSHEVGMKAIEFQRRQRQFPPKYVS